uniref:BHLH domain-containing protein n=1 Tax=Tetranychus urticae TaxID=32264 RepID=T1KQ22_TETUR
MESLLIGCYSLQPSLIDLASKEPISSLKIIKIEASSVSESFINSSTRLDLSSPSPKSPSLSCSSSPQPSTVITSIRVSPNHRSQCYITTTYTPYRDLIRTNLINTETSSPAAIDSKQCSGEPATSTSPSTTIGTVSSSSAKSRNGRSVNKRNGRWTFTNCRERQRQQNVNEAFQELRSKIPTQPIDKKLSKCSILTRAIEYIKLLNGILEKMDDNGDYYSQGTRKRARYDSEDTQLDCKPSSRNSLLTTSSSSSIHDYESDCPNPGEDEEEKYENANLVKTGNKGLRERQNLGSSRLSCNNRPLETNVSITRVNGTIQSPQFSQITDRVILDCSPVNGSSQRSFTKENLSDGFSQDSQETIRSSEDKIIMDDVSLVSYEFDSSREQSISSTVSSPSDSD